MVEFSGLVKINFFKKENFTGSCGGMCFKVESKDKNSALLASIWPGPYSSDNTPDEKKTVCRISIQPRRSRESPGMAGGTVSGPERFMETGSDWVN